MPRINKLYLFFTHTHSGRTTCRFCVLYCMKLLDKMLKLIVKTYLHILCLAVVRHLYINISLFNFQYLIISIHYANLHFLTSCVWILYLSLLISCSCYKIHIKYGTRYDWLSYIKVSSPQASWLVIHAWWRHQMETFSALLVLCAGNSPVTGEFPSQRPVTRSFDVFCYMLANKGLRKIQTLVIWHAIALIMASLEWVILKRQYQRKYVIYVMLCQGLITRFTSAWGVN